MYVNYIAYYSIIPKLACADMIFPIFDSWIICGYPVSTVYTHLIIAPHPFAASTAVSLVSFKQDLAILVLYWGTGRPLLPPSPVSRGLTRRRYWMLATWHWDGPILAGAGCGRCFWAWCAGRTIAPRCAGSYRCCGRVGCCDRTVSIVIHRTVSITFRVYLKSTDTVLVGIQTYVYRIQYCTSQTETYTQYSLGTC